MIKENTSREPLTYLVQIDRMTKKVIELKQNLDFIIVNKAKESKDSDQDCIAKDTTLREVLAELENHIDDMLDRIRC